MFGLQNNTNPCGLYVTARRLVHTKRLILLYKTVVLNPLVIRDYLTKFISCHGPLNPWFSVAESSQFKSVIVVFSSYYYLKCFNCKYLPLLKSSKSTETMINNYKKGYILTCVRLSSNYTLYAHRCCRYLVTCATQFTYDHTSSLK